jgi:hypothetical protein
MTAPTKRMTNARAGIGATASTQSVKREEETMSEPTNFNPKSLDRVELPDNESVTPEPAMMYSGTFVFDRSTIPSLVADYVAKMETERTSSWCKCEWIIHPEDVTIDPNNCNREGCHHPRMVHDAVVVDAFDGNDTVTCSKCDCVNYVQPRKRRMRRGDQHPNCPIHTKEGFILGFFEWVFRDATN